VRATESALVTRIGHVAVLFRANPKLSRFPLPDA
jgi:RNA-binding protein YhbY